MRHLVGSSARNVKSRRRHWGRQREHPDCRAGVVTVVNVDVYIGNVSDVRGLLGRADKNRTEGKHQNERAT